MKVYRVQKQIYAASFWRPSPMGRWNPAGTGVIYLCDTNATALLENAVHVRVSLFSIAWIYGTAVIPDALVENVEDVYGLPEDWNSPATPRAAFPMSTQTLGEHWVAKGRKPVLSVPSVVLPECRNYLLNPGHEQFSKITLSAPARLPLDPRMNLQS